MRRIVPALLAVARDDRRIEQIEASLAFFSPKVRTITLPAWDTVPYDRIGPHPDIVARRITTLAILAAGQRKEPTVVLTTVNAVLSETVISPLAESTANTPTPEPPVTE